MSYETRYAAAARRRQEEISDSPAGIEGRRLMQEVSDILTREGYARRGLMKTVDDFDAYITWFYARDRELKDERGMP